MAMRNTYNGPERRVHHVYVTHNTEYHVRKGVCVAVKPRNSDAWIANHGALRMRLDGLFKQGTLRAMPARSIVGSCMYFSDGDDEILTSPVIAVVRPPKSVVFEYPPESQRA